MAEGGVGSGGGLAVSGYGVDVALGGGQGGVAHEAAKVGDRGALGGQERSVGVPVGVGVRALRLAAPEAGCYQDLAEEVGVAAVSAQ